MTENGIFGFGAIGFGGFAQFSVQHFMQNDSVRLIGIAGSKREEAVAAAKRFGAVSFASVEELLDQGNIDIVYISTPPFLHFEQSMLALRAGKHVICEKPLALAPHEARTLVDFAGRQNLLIVTNLMQRYNPYFQSIGRLISQRLLGEFLHGYFENYASDENLLPGHWFWDTQLSGGIFIEHGVHFFDLFEGWFGKGATVAAQALLRPSGTVVDQVHATVKYGNALVNFYHGFTQPGKLDRQEMRLLFERGDITMHEWVPSRLVLRALVDETMTRTLMELFPGATLDITETYGGVGRKMQGRHKHLDVCQKIVLTHGCEAEKMHVYGQLLRDFFADQLAYLRDADHPRVITAENGLNSIIAADSANRLIRL